MFRYVYYHAMFSRFGEDRQDVAFLVQHLRCLWGDWCFTAGWLRLGAPRTAMLRWSVELVDFAHMLKLPFGLDVIQEDGEVWDLGSHGAPILLSLCTVQYLLKMAFEEDVVEGLVVVLADILHQLIFQEP